MGWLWLVPRGARRGLHFALFVTGVAVVVGPWMFRCYQVSGRFVLIQGASAVNWYVPTLSNMSQTDEETLWRYFENKDPYGLQLSAACNPVEMLDADKTGFRDAIRNIQANPWQYVRSRLRYYPHLIITSFDTFTHIDKSFGSLWEDGDTWRFILKATLLTVFSLAPLLFGVVSLVIPQKTVASKLSLLFWLVTLLIHIPMWIEYRFWLPVTPFLFISAATSIYAGWRRYLQLLQAAVIFLPLIPVFMIPCFWGSRVTLCRGN
jgi:hypothetical protein